MAGYGRNLQNKIAVRIGSLNGLVLDLGCGDGGWWAFLKSRSRLIVGIDLSKYRLLKLKEKFNEADVIVGDALHLPFRTASFDFIFAAYLFHHIPNNLEHGMHEAYRVLNSKGRLFAFDPNRMHPFISINSRLRSLRLGSRFHIGDYTDPAERPLTSRELKNSAFNAGFRNISLEFFSAIPSKLIEKYPHLILLEKLFERLPFLCGNIFFKAEK
jgi:ubiquinone/menaquinone biosynthesis C-methylase UbiE